ncbi:MAG: hypothetical protein QOH00_2320 [Gaiellales bacterium]|jgi:hypothetical protein|nr:hypothetical protein [Gaiellales bacterium]
MGISRARFRHLVASAQRNLGYSPTYAAKQRSAYRSTGRAPGRPKKRSAPKTDEIAEMLSTWSASYRTQAAISADAAVAQEYEAWAAVVDSWRRRGLANLEELGEFLQRRQADLRRNRSRRVPYDYDGAMRVHRYDEDPVRREMREDGMEATSESHLDTDLPQF